MQNKRKKYEGKSKTKAKKINKEDTEKQKKIKAFVNSVITEGSLTQPWFLAEIQSLL